jgi:hypothetical protein
MALTNPQTEPQHALAVLISEAPGTRSREAGTVLAGSGATRTLTSGMVLGKRLVGATATATAHSGNTGAGTWTSSPDVTVTGPAKTGAYHLEIIDDASPGPRFALFDPNGVLVGTGTCGVAFSAGGLAFTLTEAASPDLIVGDGFTIEVSGGGYKWLAVDPAGTLGEQNAAGILLSPETITAPDGSDVNGAAILVRDAEVNASELVWPTVTPDPIEDWTIQLAQLGIIVRTAA